MGTDDFLVRDSHRPACPPYREPRLEPTGVCLSAGIDHARGGAFAAPGSEAPRVVDGPLNGSALPLVHFVANGYALCPQVEDLRRRIALFALPSTPESRRLREID